MRIFKLILLVSCFTTNIVQAQSNSYFSIKDDGHMYQIIRTSTNHYVTLGTNSSQGVTKLQLAKWDASFNEQWNYEFPSADISAIDQISYLKESRFGSYYLCVPAPTGNAIVFKISPTGDLIWQKEYGVSGFVIANAFQIAPEGDDGFIFGTGSCSVSNGIVKCDGAGNIEWQKVFNRSDAGGVITCSGIVNHGSGYIITSKFNGDSFVNQKIDASGNLLSYKAYKNNSKTMSAHKSIAYGDGIAILGDYNSSNNNIDRFICFVDSNLTLTVYNDLVVAAGSTLMNGDYCVDGTGQNILLTGQKYNGTNSRSFILSLSSSGNINWKAKSSNPGGLAGMTAWSDRVISVGSGDGSVPVISITDNTGAGFCDSLTLDVNNYHPTLALLTGTTYSYDITSFWGSTATITSTNDIEYTRTMICGSAPVGIESNDEIQQLSIYPNPASDAMVVEFGSENSLSLIVTDLSGKAIINRPNFVSGTRIDLTDLKSGLYIIHLKSETQLIFQKFIKQ